MVIPAALGIALSRPNDRVVAMAGDGIELTATVDTVEAFEEKVSAFLAQDRLSFVCAAVEPTRQKPSVPYTLRPPEVRLQFEQ